MVTGCLKGAKVKFKLTSKVRTFYGEKDYTIQEALLSGKGYLGVKNDLFTKWKNVYYYKQGFLLMPIDGREAKRFAKENGVEIKELPDYN